LEITNGDCVALSNCVEVIIVSTDENDASQFSMFPNPGKEFLNLEFTGSKIPVAVFVMDLTGRILYSSTLRSGLTHYSVDLSSESRGAYLIRIAFEWGHYSTQKWIKH
jgi:hypothetical protein